MHERWLSAKPKIIENKKRVACMLTNLSNNYWRNIVRDCDSTIRKPYNEQEIFDIKTSQLLENYRNFFIIEEIKNK
jgi:hypothetical protein